MNLLLAIVSAIRKELPTSSGFCVGIKLNSSDYVVSGRCFGRGRALIIPPLAEGRPDRGGRSRQCQVDC